MARSVVGHQLVNFLRAGADLEKAIDRVVAELNALSEREDTEWIQVWPAFRALEDRLERLWPHLSTSLQGARKTHESRYQEAVDSYAARLGALLRGRGWTVVGDDSQPVIDGVVFVQIDGAKPEVRLNGRIAQDLAAGSIVQGVDETLKRIQSRRTTPESFVKALERAYDEEIRSSGGRPGDQVRIAAIHQRLLLGRQSNAFLQDPRTEVFKEYPAEIFRADLYSALTDKIVTSGKRRLRIASGSDTQGALFMVVPELGRPGHVGRIWFEA
jgi:hypothetical protein